MPAVESLRAVVREIRDGVETDESEIGWLLVAGFLTSAMGGDGK